MHQERRRRKGQSIHKAILPDGSDVQTVYLLVNSTEYEPVASIYIRIGEGEAAVTVKAKVADLLAHALGTAPAPDDFRLVEPFSPAVTSGQEASSSGVSRVSSRPDVAQPETRDSKLLENAREDAREALNDWHGYWPGA